MNRAKSAAALVSGVLAFTAIAAVPHGYSLSPAKPQAAYSATINELEYTLERNTTLTWQFSTGVTDASSSNTSVCTVTVVEQDSIEIRPTGSGYADVTINTPMDYVYVIHITVLGNGVTTAPKTTTSAKSTTTTKATSAIKPSSTTKTGSTSRVTTVSTQPMTTTVPTGLMHFPSDAECFNKASTQTESIDILYSTYSQNPGYSMFGDLDYITEMVDSQGEIYAAIGSKDSATVIQKSNFHHTIMNNPGYTFGSAVFGDDDCIYALWGKTLADSKVDELNVVVTKFTKSGQYLDMYTLSSANTNSVIPFDAGNGRLAYKDGKLAVMFDTEWKSGHQGAELYRLDTATGKFDISRTNVCSHSFGIDLITTDTGFVSIQKGDCYDRGLILQELTSAGRTSSNIAWHISGVYSEPGEHQNATFTEMGGIAYTPDTYAICGKSERFYTSTDYKSFKTGIYDGFVRIISRTGDNSDIGGTNRLDEQTGKVADSNVIWLTDSSGRYKTGNVKIAALSGNRYCVMWEVLNGREFDHVSYEIISDKGEILQPETYLSDARLSSTTVDPIVQNDVLTWAVADSKTQNITWYSLDTNSYLLRGDVNSDGIVSSADLVKYSKYLLGADKLDYRQESCSDLNSDGAADTFDIVLLRKRVIEKTK